MYSLNDLAGGSVLIGIIIILALLALYTFLIMIIWNKVIIKKFPQQNIQKLSFWDALALGVFVSLLSGGTTVLVTKNTA